MALDSTAPGLDAERPWQQEVSPYASDDGERLLLFDPLAPPAEILGSEATAKPR